MAFLGKRPADVVVSGQLLAPGSVTEQTLQNAAVTAQKLAAGAAVANIPEGGITDAKIAAMAAAKLTGRVPAANANLGAVLQVVNVTKTDVFSTTSTSFVDVTGLSASITPISATSKILVITDLFMGCANASGIQWRLVRNSTAIAVTTSGASLPATGGYYSETGSSAGNTWNSNSANFLDAPNTTSSTTYKVQYRSGGGATVFVNRRAALADFGGVSSITLMEIAA